MKHHIYNYIAGISLSLVCLGAFGQENAPPAPDLGQLHGNFEITAQYYNEDSLIGAPDFPERVGANAFLNLIYVKGNFESGVRFESYEPVLQGYPTNFEGSGVGLRYARYRKDELDITAGHFYEQFGSGLILRTYEERALGVDNAIDGIRVKYKPFRGVYLTGLMGKQRFRFENRVQNGDGRVRGFDAELNINELIPSLAESRTQMTVGGSFVSKFQADRDPLLVLPENVSSYGGRFSLTRGKFSFLGEYAYKINDPSADNNFIFKDGQAVFVSGSYSKKGLGITLAAKTIDNMSFRSDRSETVNNLTINYLPALTRQHTYNLAATLYPYATQPTGEVGYQADLIYKIPKKTYFGGRYGTTVSINYSGVNSLDTTQIPENNVSDSLKTLQGYTTNFFSLGSQTFFKDFNIEVTRKLSKKTKITASYVNFVFNNDVVKLSPNKGTFFTDIAILDVTYKIRPKHTLRVEAQHLWINSVPTKVDSTNLNVLSEGELGETISAERDNGDWAAAIVEYTFSPHWIVSVIDQYNYNNNNKDLRIHYVTGSVVYVNKGTRIMLSYGRQRAGVFCVGGVYRNVPASNGLTLSLTSSF
ncbi:MAG: DUF6029 family protein [Salibacteraceae bacterium]